MILLYAIISESQNFLLRHCQLQVEASQNIFPEQHLDVPVFVNL
jgi:hypothetical protein